MNNKRREMLLSARPLLTKAANIIEMVKDQEEDALDNVPENLQGTERYESMESVVENLDAALQHIENAEECLSEVIP